MKKLSLIQVYQCNTKTYGEYLKVKKYMYILHWLFVINSSTNFIFSNVSGVAPHQYPELVEYNPVIAYDVLICLMSTNQITDYFSGKSLMAFF